MKKLLYLLMLLSACKSNPDKKVAATVQADSAGKTKPADTTFLLKEAKKGFYHAVFIEKNRESKVYKRLLDFKYDHYDSIAYNENYKILKVKFKKPLKKYDVASLGQDWLPLYAYKGKYYLYAPSDWGNTGRRRLTDSTLTYWSIDGPDLKPLLNFKKLSESKYTLTSQPFYQFVKKSNINIYIIDTKNKVAVWEDTALPADYRYGLYVPLQYAQNFDMVHNYCKTDKMPEFVFDKIDFKALIKGL
ncbi:MAG: hypothetical protein WC615_09095 [Mucilaginibacter sp.]|jgi:hypothetical protein|uniref:hypothetical protein n=1 Tax=Mucilaginibacter sp. TaxID=1882438 RepID=UPI003567788E